jgi:hypothetical protein
VTIILSEYVQRLDRALASEACLGLHRRVPADDGKQVMQLLGPSHQVNRFKKPSYRLGLCSKDFIGKWRQARHRVTMLIRYVWIVEKDVQQAALMFAHLVAKRYRIAWHF